MAEKKEEAKEGEEVPKKKSKKKLIMIIVPVVLLLLGGVAFVLLGSKEEPKEGEEEEVVVEAPKKLKTLKLDPFIVNLSENISFLKCTLLIEFDPVLMDKALGLNGKDGKAHGGGAAGGGAKVEESGHPHFTERQPMIRDAVINVLASKKVQDVITPEGKDRLKEELIESINESLGLNEDPVVNIYFLEFIIQ
jgi:flagellar FliL protein